jgi:hypothetical protein
LSKWQSALKKGTYPMSKLEEIAFANMTAEVPRWMKEMVAGESPGMTLAERTAAASVHHRPMIGADPDAARAHDAEAAAEAQRRAQRDGGGPTVLGPQDRQRMAPRGF